MVLKNMYICDADHDWAGVMSMKNVTSALPSAPPPPGASQPPPPPSASQPPPPPPVYSVDPPPPPPSLPPGSVFVCSVCV